MSTFELLLLLTAAPAGFIVAVVQLYRAANPYVGRHVRDDGVAIFTPAHSNCRCTVTPVFDESDDMWGAIR